MIVVFERFTRAPRPRWSRRDSFLLGVALVLGWALGLLL